jgi:two-component sensor histidine kinase
MTERYRRALARLTQEDARRANLVRELQHRARNVAAIVQGIVDQSLRTEPQLAMTVTARIRAGLANDEVMHETESGPAELHDIFATALDPFDLDRFALVGETYTVTGHCRSMLALAVHELATNAVKHGALSTPAGRVAVAWKVRGGCVDIAWKETGGPAVTAPSRRGFGSIFLRRLLEGAGGAITVDFATDGVAAAIELPLVPAPARH